jgi:hypothetical protein
MKEFSMSEQSQALQEKFASTAVTQLPVIIARLEHALRIQTTATLAAAVVQASNRPVSVEEALGVRQDVQFALFGPEFTGRGSFDEWQKKKEARLHRPFK